MRTQKRTKQTRRKSNVCLMLCKWTILILCVAITPAAHGDAIVQRQSDGPIEFNFRVSDSETLIAEPLEIELEVIVPGELQVVLPALEDSLGDWEIVDKQVRENLPDARSARADLRRWSMQLTMECLQTGKVEIPSIEVQTLPRQSEGRGENATMDWEQAGSFVTEPISIHVVSVLSEPVDPMKPEPIAEAIMLPSEETASSSSTAGILVGVIGTLLAGAVLLRRIRSRRDISDADWARRRLAELHSQWQKRRIMPDECAGQLSSIYRDWIGSMMGRESTVTSDEASTWLRESDSAVAGEFLAMLNRADEVSFAGISATSAEVDAWLPQLGDWTDQLATLQVRIRQEANA